MITRYSNCKFNKWNNRQRKKHIVGKHALNVLVLCYRYDQSLGDDVAFESIITAASLHHLDNKLWCCGFNISGAGELRLYATNCVWMTSTLSPLVSDQLDDLITTGAILSIEDISFEDVYYLNPPTIPPELMKWLSLGSI